MCELVIRLRGERRKCKVYLVPVLSSFQEAPLVVAATPKHQGWFRSKRSLVMFQMTDSQMVTLSVKFLDKHRNPTAVDGVPEWLVDNPNVVALQPSADGLSCAALAVGPLGKALVSLKADADLGVGRVDVAGTFEVEIVAGSATVVEVSAGTPMEQV